MSHNLIMPLHSEGHLGCYQFLVIINRAAVNTHMLVTLWHKFSKQLGKYLGVRLL